MTRKGIPAEKKVCHKVVCGATCRNGLSPLVQILNDILLIKFPRVIRSSKMIQKNVVSLFMLKWEVLYRIATHWLMNKRVHLVRIVFVVMDVILFYERSSRLPRRTTCR